MKKLLKLMLQNNMLRDKEGDPAKGEDGANGGADKGDDKNSGLAAEFAALALSEYLKKSLFGLALEGFLISTKISISFG